MSWHKIVRSCNFKRKVKRNFQRITTGQFAIDTPEEDNSRYLTDGGIEPDPLESDIHDASTSGLTEKPASEQPSSSMDWNEDDEIDDFKKFDFSQNLKDWALKSNIRHVAIKDLLKIKKKIQRSSFRRTLELFWLLHVK
ncbi:uncharacterized protein LOC126741330 [Anthonomus grandis grandis]|uniref:uncharacterized protein LOC126741330 n=1 Tax=Anthonomus grandis grandis TaxID=2921223 RepID=UPI002165C95F|nr:uncharacterized protein LOC126741330 [Anthonomus grandis grandis]